MLQDPPSTAKQCVEETLASVVELLSEEDHHPTPGGPDTSQAHQVEEGRPPPPQVGLEVSPDYVTLNVEKTVPNKYVYEHVDDACRVNTVAFPPACARTSFHSDSCTDILNQSYLLLAEPHTDRLDYRVAGNLYTNLEDMTNNKG